ncbi:MAG: FAD-dependent oxidoreductase [Nitrososphaeria archaeon]
MKVIVVGGGAAGMSAASRVRKLLPQSEVKVFEESSYVSYAPCGLPYYVENLVEDINDLVTYTPEFFRKERNIDVHINTRVTKVDLNAKEITRISDEGEKTESFDYLILTTGAIPFVPDKKWLEINHVYALRHLEDGERLRKDLQGLKNIAVIGGGYVGVEMAEALSKINKNVTVFEMKRLMPNLDPDYSQFLRQEMEKKSVKVVEGFTVRALENTGEKVRVVGDSEQPIFDAAVLGLGVKPNVELARSIGLKIGETGAIWVDENMRTSNPSVYAAGDNVEVNDLVIKGRKRYAPFAPEANKEGYVAGSNIGNQNIKFPGSAGSSITKFYDTEIGVVGISEEDAKKHGIEVFPVKIRHNAKASYYPPPEEVYMKVIFDKKRRVPLGAQVIGKNVWGRVAYLSLAIENEITVDNMFFSGVPYAPPFAPVWDSLIVASRIFYERV